MQKSQHVVLVEDDAALREIFEELLQEHSSFIEQASTGEEALKLILRAEPPRLVISDLKLPHMSGIALLEIIKNEKIKTKFLAITADNELGAKARELGADEVLIKPFNIRDFSLSLEKYLS